MPTSKRLETLPWISANPLVGSAILRRLKQEGYSNLIYRSHKELDLTNRFEVETFFKEEKPEYVFLAAAKVGGIWANNTYPAEFIYSNLTIQTNIIHSSYKNEVKKLCEFHEIDISSYKGSQRKDKIARNLVDFEAGRTILEIALGIIRKSNIKQTELF